MLPIEVLMGVSPLARTPPRGEEPEYGQKTESEDDDITWSWLYYAADWRFGGIRCH